MAPITTLARGGEGAEAFADLQFLAPRRDGAQGVRTPIGDRETKLCRRMGKWPQRQTEREARPNRSSGSNSKKT